MKILIITKNESDLSDIFKNNCECDIVPPEEVNELSSYSAIAILGGTEDTPFLPNAHLRDKLECFADSGKPLFLEYFPSFRFVYSAQPERLSCHRLVAACDFSEEIKQNELLDPHFNLYIRPHFLMPNTEILLYLQKYTPAHDRLESISETDSPALFKYGNIMHCAFRLCDYLKGAFAPKSRFDAIIEYIFAFLGLNTPVIPSENSLSVRGKSENCFENELDICISNATSLLLYYLVSENGKGGIREGLSHNIHPNGKRIFSNVVRADCTGEAAGVFIFSGDKKLLGVAEGMLSLCFGPLTVHTDEFKNMMRWSEEAWGVCYQDDIARAIIPVLLAAYFGITDKYKQNALNSLDFLCKTTAKDGLRPMRTDMLEYLREGKPVTSLAELEHGYASAHYNAYYSAALLLGYLVSGKEDFKNIGIKGLETLMSLYPETVREHSETSELCRLIMPLSLLYAITHSQNHKEMLYRVFNDLQKYRHESGGYAEWDSGYKAACFNNAGGECSLLAKNGDPVSDLLYSINWLPLGFAMAFWATQDNIFREAWQSICEFFIKTQLKTDSAETNGGWCRGIDLNRLEYFGIPHDIGWGPCCIESGWTVAEITLGMLVGKRIFKI